MYPEKYKSKAMCRKYPKKANIQQHFNFDKIWSYVMVELPVFWHISLQRCFGLEQFGQTQIQCVSDLYGWLIYKFVFVFTKIQQKQNTKFWGIHDWDCYTWPITDMQLWRKWNWLSLCSNLRTKTNIETKLDKLKMSRHVDF